MCQTIELAVTFRDTSFTMNIRNVYQVNGQLIAISDISSRGFGGEAMTLRSASISVNTEAVATLPVKHYAFVSENIKSFKSFASESGQKVLVVNSLANIPELKNNLDIEPLGKVSDLVVHSVFANQPSLQEDFNDGLTIGMGAPK